uniref:Galectin n=1 Tax=Astyanax mexicanus TaxID=7994 RepID=A0A3B1JFS0_ASTMX
TIKNNQEITKTKQANKKQSFAINFKTGSSDGDDVALHFNPLIGQKVTLNSFRNGKWESEESASVEPFTRGAPFTIFNTPAPHSHPRPCKSNRSNDTREENDEFIHFTGGINLNALKCALINATISNCLL